jgi:hypothetical protein
MKVEDLSKSFMLLATMLEPNRKIWQSFKTRNENLNDLTSRKQKERIKKIILKRKFANGLNLATRKIP